MSSARKMCAIEVAGCGQVRSEALASRTDHARRAVLWAISLVLRSSLPRRRDVGEHGHVNGFRIPNVSIVRFGKSGKTTTAETAKRSAS